MEKIREFISYYYDRFNDVYNYLFKEDQQEKKKDPEEEKELERRIKKKIIKDYNKSKKFFDDLEIWIAKGGGSVDLLNEFQIDEYIKSFTDEIVVFETLSSYDPLMYTFPVYNKLFDLENLYSVKKRKKRNESESCAKKQKKPELSWTGSPESEDDDKKDKDFIPLKVENNNQIQVQILDSTEIRIIYINPITQVAVSNLFVDVDIQNDDITQSYDFYRNFALTHNRFKKFVFKIPSPDHIFSVYVNFEEKYYTPIDTLDIKRDTTLEFVKSFFGSKGLKLVPIELEYYLQETEKEGLCQLWTSFFCFYLYYYDIEKVKEIYQEFTKIDKNFYKVILLTWAYNNISTLRSGRFYFNKLSKKKVKSLKKSNSEKKVKSLKKSNLKKSKTKSDPKKSKTKSNLKNSDPNSKKKVKSLKKSNSNKKVKSLKKSNSEKKVKSLKKSNSKKKVKSLKTNSKKKVKSLKINSKKKVKSLKKSNSKSLKKK
jgi:hypothetical protein